MYKIRAIGIDNKKEILKELEAIGCDKAGAAYMTPKGVFKVIKLEQVKTTLANIVKQEMLAKGGEAAVTRGVVNNSVDHTDMILMGTIRQYQQLIQKLKMQPFGAKHLAEELEFALNSLESAGPRIIRAGDKEIIIGKRTLVMGILNVTPDSFSDGGKWNAIDEAINHAHQMVEDGVDIIDLGGESTRPGFLPISAEEELDRVIPVLKRLVQEVRVPISIDTTKAEVAKQAIEAGAHIINDQWALRADADMAKVVGQYNVPVILMHNQNGTEYKDFIGDMIEFFEASSKMAIEAGVKPENIIIDPGVGFGKDDQQNLEVIRRLDEFKALGKPILLATSRKRVIGNTLKLPVSERMEGTGATVAIGIVKGADMVRVHDVKEIVRIARMTDAMVRM